MRTLQTWRHNKPGLESVKKGGAEREHGKVLSLHPQQQCCLLLLAVDIWPYNSIFFFLLKTFSKKDVSIRDENTGVTGAFIIISKKTAQ